MYKCINCKWEGEDTVGPLKNCPVCGDNTEQIGEAPKKEKDTKTVEVPKEVAPRVKDYVDDLKDDGKRNYSNRKKKGKKK